jgi:hypothetical protein
MSFGWTTKRIYSGPELPKSQIAVVHEYFRFYGFIFERFFITVVDGAAVPGRIRRVELLPGHHNLGINFQNYWIGLGSSSLSPIIIGFQAEAGHTYRIKGLITNERWGVGLVDDQTGNTIRNKSD